MLEITKTEGLPSVVVANKADLEGALTPEKIRERMALPEEIPIIPATAEDLKQVKKNLPCRIKKEDIENVLTRLFEMVIQNA